MASIIVYVYAAIMMVGGIGGYMMKKSVPSLVAGVLSGVILIAAGQAMAKGKSWGLPTSIVVILALMFFFGSRYFGNPERPFMPGGMNALLSLIALIALLVVTRGRSGQIPS